MSIPAVANTSADQHVLQAKTLATVNSCIRAAWEESTHVRYDAALRSVANPAESASGLSLLPCDSDTKLMCLFASLDGKPWGTISTARAAVRAWHQERGLVDPFDSAWTDRASRFWKSFKKRADHTLSRAKEP